MPFYQCSQCQKKWQYTITKCLDCFSELEKKEEGTIKVIGISEVNIPTVLHPETPYFVLLLEDENGNRWAHKSVKEYDTGDKFILEPAKDKSAVAIWRIKYDLSEAIEKTIHLIDGVKVNKSSRVLILPTLLSPRHPHLAENTSPEFLESIINYLLQKGADPEKIKVASQSFNKFPIEASAKKSQLLKVCFKNKIQILDLSKTNFIKKEKDGLIFEVSNEAFNNDLIINLPILKLDSKLKLQGATQNILQLLKKESYLSLQNTHSFQDLLKKIPKYLPEYLTLAEANTIKKQNRHTVFLGLVLASFNPFNLDKVFTKITMTRDLPEYLKDIRIDEVQVVGRQIDELKYHVEGV
ncbi:MAG: DUF362 domain-containing protein [Patescibacteria group bacterium]|nr:DUF362 domain-containing protein [Patescibacteria group bacterium]